MRTVLSSLIVAAGVATAAYAQEPAPPPASAVAPPPAAAEPAPAPVPAAPAPEPTAAPPTLPTSGDGYEIIQLLEKVCVPAVRGQKLDDVAKANGFKLNRREQTWAKPLGSENRAYQIIVFPTGSNTSVCSAELRFAVGQDVDIVKALNIWSFLRQPPLEPTANYTQPVDPDGLKRVRRSWEYLTSTDSIGLNFSTVRKPDDTPVNPKFDTATIQYQERKF
jgi:hypothetical protein